MSRESWADTLAANLSNVESVRNAFGIQEQSSPIQQRSATGGGIELFRLA